MTVNKGLNLKMYKTDLRHISYVNTYSVQNEMMLLADRVASGPAMFAARLHNPGFWRMSEKPIIIFHKGCKIASRDIDLMRAFWIVSDRCKDAMTSIDPSGFDFLDCDCYDDKGKLLEKRWLCAVMRTLDVLDEQATNVVIARGPNKTKNYMIESRENMIFKINEIPSDVHIFNMAHTTRTKISSQIFRNTMNNNVIGNILFQDVRKRHLIK